MSGGSNEMQKRKILIVEDDVDMARMLKTRLESAGYSIRIAGTGQAALSQVVEETPDLVILDLRLPDFSGYEVCRKLREFSKPWQIPVLVSSGLSQPMDQLRGFVFGADAYLTKPFNVDQLLKTVERLIKISEAKRAGRLPNPLPRLENLLEDFPQASRILREFKSLGSPPVPPERNRRKIGQWRIPVSLGAALLFLLAVALIPKVLSPASAQFAITDALLCKDMDKDGNPLETASEFPKDIGKIICWFSWKRAPSNLPINGRWYYLTEDYSILDVSAILPKNSGQGKFSLEMPPGRTLPAGMYRFDFIIRGKVVKTIPFTVGANEPAAVRPEASF